MIVYLITNKINGKQYVGQTVATLETRWTKHLYQASTNKATYLHKSIRKYGADAFKREVIGTFKDRAFMLLAEQSYITKLKTKRPSGYNLTDGGDGTVGFTKAGPFKDLKGCRFGRLLVKAKSTKTSTDRRAYWVCVCDCGNETIKEGKQLRLGKVKSCGCLRSELMSELASRPGGIKARAATAGGSNV